MNKYFLVIVVLLLHWSNGDPQDHNNHPDQIGGQSGFHRNQPLHKEQELDPMQFYPIPNTPNRIPKKWKTKKRRTCPARDARDTRDKNVEISEFPEPEDEPLFDEISDFSSPPTCHKLIQTFVRTPNGKTISL